MFGLLINTQTFHLINTPAHLLDSTEDPIHVIQSNITSVQVRITFYTVNMSLCNMKESRVTFEDSLLPSSVCVASRWSQKTPLFPGKLARAELKAESVPMGVREFPIKPLFLLTHTHTHTHTHTDADADRSAKLSSCEFYSLTSAQTPQKFSLKLVFRNEIPYSVPPGPESPKLQRQRENARPPPLSLSLSLSLPLSLRLRGPPRNRKFTFCFSWRKKRESPAG